MHNAEVFGFDTQSSNLNDSHARIGEHAKNVRAFVDEFIIPNEGVFAKEGERSISLQKELEHEVRRQGLWGAFYPKNHGGSVYSLQDYLVIAEQEARSEFSQSIFGTHSSLDAHMINDFGSEELKARFLHPLSTGEAISAYAMTDYGKAGSIPAHIETNAKLDKESWVINGRKCFICNSKMATFFTVVVKTSDNDTVDNNLSMIIVPASCSGFSVDTEIEILGKNSGQGEICFKDVRVPINNILGDEGQAIALMKIRLRMGRLLRSMQWLGLAQRCFDMMGYRVLSDRGQVSKLTEKQILRSYFVDVYQAIAGARELVRLAAGVVDRTRIKYEQNTDGRERECIDRPEAKHCDILVNSAKLAASKAICLASDLAIQVYGAEGLRSDHPLSGIYRIARTTRILDGADEALNNAIGKQIIQEFKAGADRGFTFNFGEVEY